MLKKLITVAGVAGTLGVAAPAFADWYQPVPPPVYGTPVQPAYGYGGPAYGYDGWREREAWRRREWERRRRWERWEWERHHHRGHWGW
jgi:hypothetical protein